MKTAVIIQQVIKSLHNPTDLGIYLHKSDHDGLQIVI